MTVPMHAVMTCWTWLAALCGFVAFGTFGAPEGAAAEGGAATAEASADADAGDAGETTADAGEEPIAGEVERAAGTVEDEDPDDEDAGLPEDVRNNPTRLKTRLRRVQRQLGELRPVADRLRGPDGKFYNVEDLLYKSREFDQIDAQLRTNPKLRELFGAPAADDTAAAGDDPFDPAALPFEVDNEQGQFFARQAQTIHEQNAQIKKLTARLDGLEQGRQAETVAQHETTWKTATLAAANQIADPGVRDLFITAIYHGAFKRALSEGTLSRVDVNAVIRQQLAKLKVSQDTKNRAAAAASQRVAEGNKSQPRAPRGPGAPASAAARTAPDANVRVADVSRSFLKRHT